MSKLTISSSFTGLRQSASGIVQLVQDRTKVASIIFAVDETESRASREQSVSG